MTDFSGKWPPDFDKVARLLGSSALISGCILSEDGVDLTMSIGKAIFTYTQNEQLISTGVVDIPEVKVPLSSLPKAVQGYTIYLKKDFTLEFEEGAGILVGNSLDKIYIGNYVTDGVSILSLINLTDTVYSNIPEALRDLQYALRPLRRRGLEMSADSVNPLKVELSEGEVLILGGFIKAGGSSPNVLKVPTFTIPGYFYQYQDGAGGWTIDFTGTEINPGKYDNGSGTLKNVRNNRWSIQRLYGDEALNAYVYYGQKEYRNLEDAIEGLYSDPFQKNSLNEFSYFLGYIIMKGNCNDLDDTGECIIILPSFVSGEINVNS